MPSKARHRRLWSLLLVLACGSSMTGATIAGQGRANPPDPPLRTGPVDEIAVEIEQLVQPLIADGSVVGLQVALIREGRVVWERGFGVANTITRAPVTPQTVFPAASLGKPLVAYLTLREAERGALALDKPLQQSLAQPRVAAEGAGITLRHVLTHTSGLSNFLRDRARRPLFPPGKEFSYSGVGFVYLQETLRAMRGESLDATARGELFRPLAMPRSYFGVPSAENLPHASGHTRVRDVLIPVAILLGPGAVFMLAAVSVMTRIIRGRWMPSWKSAVAGLLPAIAAVTWFLYARSGSRALSAYFVGCFLALGTAALGAGALLAWSLARTVPARFAWFARIAGALAGLVVVLAFALPRFIPIPSWFPEEGNAASSLRSTAGDLGRFLGELSRPQLLRPEMATAFRTAQVRVNGDISWGLGIGIQHSEHGDALWHLGSNPASKAFFAVYPSHGLGVVVLTNSDGSLALAREIAARALGGKASWSLASDP